MWVGGQGGTHTGWHRLAHTHAKLVLCVLLAVSDQADCMLCVPATSFHSAPRHTPAAPTTTCHAFSCQLPL